MPSALLILTGARTWTMKDGTPHPTGFWAREFIEAYQVFTEAGKEVTIATPGATPAEPDPLGFNLAYNDNDADAVAKQEQVLEDLKDRLAHPADLNTVRPGEHDIVFIIGGHGPMQDLAVNPAIGEILAANLDDPAKMVGSVCHGSAGFLSAHRADGSWLFAGRKLTGFTNEEENMATFAGNAPWLLEDRLRLAGAQFIKGPAYTEHVVVDGNLVTGQQNVSSGAAARAILEQMKVSV